ncbi:hypothetical protein H6P81_009156 [Aristolochia fimbriata]|uniref:Uncharacterized protein n=1 Tax=Aristolochia fimbriata TaxID=158543 RepID=A0AAV7EN87_ARIFI|nr:hypothetical protein H6P81_009156 [Aristolochia fimbriata]
MKGGSRIWSGLLENGGPIYGNVPVMDAIGRLTDEILRKIQLSEIQVSEGCGVGASSRLLLRSRTPVPGSDPRHSMYYSSLLAFNFNFLFPCVVMTSPTQIHECSYIKSETAKCNFKTQQYCNSYDPVPGPFTASFTRDYRPTSPVARSHLGLARSLIMDHLYGKKTVWSFVDQEQQQGMRSSMVQQSPTTTPHLSLRAASTHHVQSVPESADVQVPPLSPARLSSAASPFAPSSPESPWALSPLCASPSPSLLYHCIASLHRLDGGVYSIAISKGMVFTGSASRRVRVWRQPECLERGHLKTSSGNIGAILAFDNMLFTTHKDHKIRVWTVSLSDRLASKKLATLPRRTNLNLLPSLSMMMRSSSSTAAHHHHHHHHKDVVSCLAYYHAEGLLYSASWDRTVKTWRVAEKRCIDSFVAHDDRVNAIVVNQDDGFVFTGSSDGSIKIWRRMCGDVSHALTMTLKFQPSPVNALVLTSFRGSCFLYSGSSDGLVNFWEKESIFGRYHHGGFLQGHRFAVLCLAAVDKLILSGSEDTTIRIWTREDGSTFHVCLALIDGHRGPIKCLAACVEMEKLFMGFLLYSASLDRTVKVWRIKILAGTDKATPDDTEDEDVHKNMMVDHEMSPVLSPSWIEKKLQGIH